MTTCWVHDLCTENPPKCTERVPKAIATLNNVAGYKVNMSKCRMSLYTEPAEQKVGKNASHSSTQKH